MAIPSSIYTILDRYRKNPYGLHYDSSILLEKIKYFIDRNKPIKMIIPACHGKVDSDYCVFDHMPDLGDILGLRNFIALCEEINHIYEHGCELMMLHEGHFYVDMLVKNDETVDSYLSKIRALIAPYPYIKSMALRDFFPALNSYTACREQFFADYAPSCAELETLIAENPRFKQVYVGYKKIYTSEFIRHKLPQLSVTQHRKEAKKRALIQLQTYLGFGKIVTAFFNDQVYIRLSTLYKDPSVTDQVAINYLPNKHHLSTPSFHCVVKYKNGDYDFIKRKEAMARGYQVCKEEEYPYFMEL